MSVLRKLSFAEATKEYIALKTKIPQTNARMEADFRGTTDQIAIDLMSAIEMTVKQYKNLTLEDNAFLKDAMTKLGVQEDRENFFRTFRAAVVANEAIIKLYLQEEFQTTSPSIRNVNLGKAVMQKVLNDTKASMTPRYKAGESSDEQVIKRLNSD